MGERESLTNVTPGDPITAARWNDLVGAVRASLMATGSWPIETQSSPSGRTFSVRSGSIIWAPGVITAVSATAPTPPSAITYSAEPIDRTMDACFNVSNKTALETIVRNDEVPIWPANVGDPCVLIFRFDPTLADPNAPARCPPVTQLWAFTQAPAYGPCP